ncbi:hypothetical protein B0H10DRAFT_2062051 [Mycena sp. CBHHK59/15]|nr:hypothetical protein B0H10DRAFT_2062051 [Mycena sp. CBHHK59/15]
MFRPTLIPFLFSLLVLQSYAATAGWEYIDCGVPSQPIQIGSIKVYLLLLVPSHMPGKDLTVTVDALVTERIEEGAFADVTVKLGLIKLLQKTFDVCEEARNANATVSCPVEEGPYTVVQTVALPKEIPKAKFVLLVRGFTVEERDMLCLDLKIDFMKSLFW